jgi:hypothetical protein
MHTYSAFLQRHIPSAGPVASFTIKVQAVTSEMARVTAEAQYPGYKCFNLPVRVNS